MTVTQEEIFKVAGGTLREIREAKGKSQEDVSYEIGMDQSSYSKVERQGPQATSWSKLLRIAQTLDCTIEISFKPKPSGG
jgi:transcriptional regulator with XRE-family HTH domain